MGWEYFSILVVVVLLHQLVLAHRSKHYDFLGVAVMVDIFIVVFFGWGVYQDGVTRLRFAEEWTYGLVVMVGVLALYVGLHLPLIHISPPLHHHLNSTYLYINPRWLWTALAIHVGCATVLFDLNASLGGISLLQYFFGPRLGSYLKGAFFEGGGYYQVLTVTLAPALVLLMLYVRRKKWWHGAIIYTLLLYSAAAVFRTRLGLIILLLLPAFELYRRLQTRRAGLLALPLLLVGFVLLMGTLQMWRGFGARNINEHQLSLEFAASSNVEGVANTTRAFRWIVARHLAGNLRYEYGLNYWYSVVTFVPRRFWPEKPLTAFEPRWTEYMLNRKVGSGIPIWTFTAWGEGLAQFGLFGVALNLFLYGQLVRVFDQLLSSSISFFARCTFGIIAGTFLRGGFQAMLVFALLFGASALVFLRLSIHGRKANGLTQYDAGIWPSTMDTVAAPAPLHGCFGPRGAER